MLKSIFFIIHNQWFIPASNLSMFPFRLMLPVNFFVFERWRLLHGWHEGPCERAVLASLLWRLFGPLLFVDIALILCQPLAFSCYQELHHPFCLSLLSSPSEVEWGDCAMQNNTGHNDRACRDWDRRERKMSIIIRRWDSRKVGESRSEQVCGQRAVPAYVPFSAATDGPPISQLLGCSRGSGTLALLFLLLARPTAQ